MFLNNHRSHYAKPTRDKLQAFTLIELLVVIVIIGILATLTTVSLTSARGKARDARRISDLKQIATALELYQADNNSYPTLITGGNSLVSPDGAKVYMKKVPSDPSTNASYAYYGSTSRFTLRTTIEKSVDNIPVGPVIVTSGGGVKQAVNTDNSFMNADLTFGGTLVGHWALDGNTGTADLSGNGNNGTISGTVATTTGRFSEADGTYDFSSSNITIPAASSLQNQNFTISFWASANQISAGSSGVIGTTGYINPIGKGVGLYSNTGNNYNVWIGNNVTGNEFMSSIFTITVGFNYYTVTKSGLNWNAYKNGVVTKSGSFVSGIINYSGVFWYLGQSISSFNGKLSDVRFYNKGLLDSEVTQLYNATRP